MMFVTANDLPGSRGDEFADMTSRALYYYALAGFVRSQIYLADSVEARDQLASLASSYDMLARQFESRAAP